MKGWKCGDSLSESPWLCFPSVSHWHLPLSSLCSSCSAFTPLPTEPLLCEILCWWRALGVWWGSPTSGLRCEWTDPLPGLGVSDEPAALAREVLLLLGLLAWRGPGAFPGRTLQFCDAGQACGCSGFISPGVDFSAVCWSWLCCLVALCLTWASGEILNVAAPLPSFQNILVNFFQIVFL